MEAWGRGLGIKAARTDTLHMRCKRVPAACVRLSVKH
jgi:hypothetical protein